MITMPFGDKDRFDEHDLIAHILGSTSDFIIIGGSNCCFRDHQKPRSLDYWLRMKTKRMDTRQSCQELVDSLVATGLFVEEDKLTCPDSGELCKGLRLTNSAMPAA